LPDESAAIGLIRRVITACRGSMKSAGSACR
jgi:hypothetical protein